MKKQPQKHPAPAIVNLFVPGVGQMMKGDFPRGIAILVGYCFSILLILLLVGFITTPILYIWSIYDAYNYNKKGDGK